MIIDWVLADPYLNLANLIDTNHPFCQLKWPVIVRKNNNSFKCTSETLNCPTLFFENEKTIGVN